VIIANNLVGFAGNLIVDHPFDGLPPRQPDNPRVSPIHVHTRDRTVKRLKVLEGVVVGELNLPEQTLVDIPNLARAVGRVHHGPNDARLTIVSHEPKQHGRWLSIRLRVEATPAATMPRLGLRNRIAMSNNSPVMPGVGIALAAGLGEARFYDDAGRLISPPPGNWTTDTIDGSRQIQEIELNFPLSGGIPVRMKAIGHKSVSVDVPFRIHNLPLP
jgi:hypothetical protein